MLSPEAPHCLEQTGMGSRRFDNICMDILGLVDEGLIGANLKCTSQKHFPWRTYDSILASLAER